MHRVHQWVPTLMMIFLLKHNIFPSSTNDMLLRGTLKASVSLVRLLLFSTLEGSCFAYDEMIVRVSGRRERVVLNVVDSDQRCTPPPLRVLQAISFTFPPICGQSAANLARLHASCLQHPPPPPTQYVQASVCAPLPSQPRRILHRLKPLNESGYSHDSFMRCWITADKQEKFKYDKQYEA